jgi:hypothetical protein
MWRRDDAKPADASKQANPTAQSTTKEDKSSTKGQESGTPGGKSGDGGALKAQGDAAKGQASAPQATQPQATQPAFPMWQPSAPLAVARMPAEREEPGHRIGQILEPALWMVGALLFSATVLMLVQAWKKRSLAARDNLHEQLAQFREAYQKGEMSKDEYHRVHALLTGRLREKMQADQLSKNPAADPAVPPPETGPASEEKPAQDNGQV